MFLLDKFREYRDKRRKDREIREQIKRIVVNGPPRGKVEIITGVFDGEFEKKRKKQDVSRNENWAEGYEIISLDDNDKKS